MIDATAPAPDVAELRAQAAALAARIAQIEDAHAHKDSPERVRAWSRLVTENAASPRPRTLAELEALHGGPRPTPIAFAPGEAAAREKKIRRNPGPLRAPAVSWI